MKTKEDSYPVDSVKEESKGGEKGGIPKGKL